MPPSQAALTGWASSVVLAQLRRADLSYLGLFGLSSMRGLRGDSWATTAVSWSSFIVDIVFTGRSVSRHPTVFRYESGGAPLGRSYTLN